MNLEIEVTKKEKQTVIIETPAYFVTEYGFRQIRVTEDQIIEVGDEICLIHGKETLFGRFGDALSECYNKHDKSNSEAFEAMLQLFLSKIQLDEIKTELQSLPKLTNNE